MLEATFRQPARRGMALGEIVSFLAVFCVGLAIGIYFLGGFDVAVATESARRWGAKAGVRLGPVPVAESSEPDGDVEDEPSQRPAALDEPDDRVEQPDDWGVERLRSQLVQLAQRAGEAAGLRKAGETPPAMDETARREAGDATLQFWNRVNAVLAREAAMRSAPAEVTAANAIGFVTARSRASEFAAGELRSLDRTGVDCRVLTLTNELIVWYDRAAQLNGEAQYLLGHADESARRGSRGEQWKQGEQDHWRRCQEINERGEALRQEMSQTYGLDFPPLE